MPSIELAGQSESLNLNCWPNLRVRKDLPSFKALSVKGSSFFPSVAGLL